MAITLPSKPPENRGGRSLRLLPQTPSDPAHTSPLEMRAAFGAAAAILVGGLIRLAMVLGADFPLNDGGMFYAMMGDLQHAGFRLPETTTYNAAGIPFSYPPLPFYIAAFLSRVTPLSAVELLRFLPFAVSVATIGAFYLLARALLASKTEQQVATFIFALLPRTSTWMVMGGGLTRSFGLLFMILALLQLRAAYTSKRRRPLIGAMLFGGLTILSHMEMTLLLLVSGLTFLAAYGRSRDALLRSVAVGAGALAVTSPWWLTIIIRDGLSPFLGASSSRSLFNLSPLIQLFTLNFSNELIFPILSTLGTGGLLVCLGRRRYALPAWLLVAAIAEPWVLATAIVVPLALLGAVGFVQGLVPVIERLAGEHPPALRRSLPIAVFCGIVTYATMGLLIAPTSTTSALSVSERSAMAFAAAKLPQDSQVLVISAEPWWRDRSSEWFPVLASRISVATPQGLEWFPNGRFDRVRDAHERAQMCATRDAACLKQWSASTGMRYTHVYVSKTVPSALKALDYADCCPALRASLYADPSYAVTYDGPGATIFALRVP